MKTLIRMWALTLLLLSVLSAGLIIGCKKGSKKTADEEANKVTTERDYKNLKTVLDSTYSDWHIIIQEAETDVKIEGYDEFDKMVLVSISKDGEVLFDKEEFTKTGLHSSLDNHFQLSGAYLEQITNTTVYISLGAFIPETDEGLYFMLAFSKDGHFKKYLHPLAMDESDFIVDFYIMYTHENLQNPVDKASLQQIAKAYGTPKFIEQLEKEGPLSIYPPEVISHYNLNVQIESESTENYDDSHLSCKALFYPHESDKLIGSMNVEVKGRKGEYDGVYYDRIDRISR